MLHQIFTTPAAGPVNARVRAGYQTTNTAGYTSFSLLGTVRDTTSGAYPNEGLVLTFLNRSTLNVTGWQASGWSTESQLSAGRSYRVQIYHDINVTGFNTNVTANIDNVYCNTSPVNLRASRSGADIVLNWDTSTGVGTLANYRVYYSTTGVAGSFVWLANVPAGTTNYTHVSPGTLYYYAVSDVETVTGDESPLSVAVLPPNITMAGAKNVNEDTDSAAITDFNCTGSAVCYPVTIVLTVSNGTLTMTNNGCTTFSNNGTSQVTIAGSLTALNNTLDTLIYRGSLNFYGSDNLNVNFSGIDMGNVAITVTPVNDAPSFTKGADQTAEENSGAKTVAGWATALSTGPANESSQSIAGFVVTNDNNALFSTQPAVAADGTLTFTPAASANGTAIVTVQVQDNGGTANGGVNTSAAQTFSIVIYHVNREPSFTKGADQVVAEDAGLQTVVGWATSLNPGHPSEGGQVLDFLVSNDNNALFSSQPAIAANGTLTFTPAANAAGVAVVTVQLHDNGGTANGGDDTSPAQTFTITVTAVNDAPTITVPAPQSVFKNGSLTLSTGNGNLITIADPDAGGNQIQVGLSVSQGKLKLNGTGGLTITAGGDDTAAMTIRGTLGNLQAALDGLVYTPSTGFTGADTLAVLLDDLGSTGSGGPLTDSDSVSLTVLVPPNTAPPTGLEALPSGGGIYLGWNPSPPENGATVVSYLLYRNLTPNDPAGATLIQTLPAGTTSTTDTWFGDPHYYFIRDLDSNGQTSPYSSQVSVAQAFPVYDGLREDLDFSWNPDRVEVNWVHPNVDFSGYRVAVGTTPGSTNVLDWTPVGTTDHATLAVSPPLASGTTYFTSVQLIDPLGNLSTLSTSNGFTVRGDQILIDTSNTGYFKYARALVNLDTTTDPGSLRPKTFAGGGLWQYRVKVTVKEPGVTARLNAPCHVTFTIPAGQQPASVNEFRVTDESGTEIPRYNLTAPAGVVSTVATPHLVFLVNLGKSEIRNYWIYWGNTGAPNPGYGFSATASLTSRTEWTPYYSRKLMEPGMEPITISAGNNFALNAGVDFQRAAAPDNIRNANDDCWSDPFNLPWNFFFFGTNVQNNWKVDSNGNLYQNSVDSGQWVNTWARFTGATCFTAGLITPAWLDYRYNNAPYPPNPGCYGKIETFTNPDRKAFTWRVNRYSLTDDIYLHQAVVYSTGDIALRYDLLSYRGCWDTAGGTDNEVNLVNFTVGISNNIGNWLRSTPLTEGIGLTPSSFFQCMDAFRNSYTVGPIEGPTGAFANRGSIESIVFDSRSTTPLWVSLDYETAPTANGQLVFSVRTGDTYDQAATGTWTLLTTVTNASPNGSVPIPAGIAGKRYLQYQCVFQGNTAAAAPVLNEVRLVCRALSVETVTASTSTGVSQGQDGIQVGVTFRNHHNADITILPANATLTFSLGSYTVSAPVLENGGVVPPGGSITGTFTVNVLDDSPTGSATIDCMATGTAGALTFGDRDAQNPHVWRVLKKAKMVISSTDTSPPTVTKGQESIPVRVAIRNDGEAPFTLDSASLTFPLGHYLITYGTPPFGTVVPGGTGITAEFSVTILVTSPSGVSLINAFASGTNTFSGKSVEATGSLVLDSWIIQNEAALILTEILASPTVYRGQANAPVLLKTVNEGEAAGVWASSVVDFTPIDLPPRTYLSKTPVSSFPVTIQGGGGFHVARYAITVSPSSATGTDDIEPTIHYTDNNVKVEVTYSSPYSLASWTVVSQLIGTYKDAAFQFPSSSFNQPLSGTRTVHARGTNMDGFTDYVVRWFDPGNQEVASSPVLTGDASGTLSHSYDLTPVSPPGGWVVKVTDPLNTYTACQTLFDVVSPASLSARVSLPPSVSVGQPFPLLMTFANAGGAIINGAYPSPLQISGAGSAVVASGPTPVVQAVGGYGQATFTWGLVAVAPGTFTASATGYGFDANSDDFLTSLYSSASTNIQNPPNVAITLVTATPTVVYRNQQNLEVQVRVRNTGSSTALVDAASLTFTAGSFTQALTDPPLPYSLGGSGAAATFTFSIDVAVDSPTGLSAFSGYLRFSDSNFPASVTVISAPTPNDSWTVATIGLLLSNNIAYDPQNYTFVPGQTIYSRAFGLTPGSSWYRIRFYSREIPNSSPAPAGWAYVSSQLAANASGTADFLYPIPAGSTPGKWSVEIETDPDLNSGTLGTLLAVQYLDLQAPGTLQASLTLSPVAPFEGDLVTATLDAGNCLSTAASLITPATASALVKTGIYGDLTYVSGPTPASASVPAMATATFVWTYTAASSTGLTGSLAMTTQLASSVTGIEVNRGVAAAGSAQAVSNPIRIYRRALSMTATNTWYQGTIAPGTTGAPVPATVINTGNATLSAIMWNTVDLNGPSGNKIPYSSLSLSPSPVSTVLSPLSPAATRGLSSQLAVPFNKTAGHYIATMTLFEDLSGNGSRDPLEPYVLFALDVDVPATQSLFVPSAIVDLGDWPPNSFTGSQTITIMSVGNLDLTDVKFETPPVATDTFFRAAPLSLGGLSVVSPTNLTTAEVSADIPNLAPALHKRYIATWTVYEDTDHNGSRSAAEPVKATFQVRVNIGAVDFSLTSPVDLGVGTPSTVVPSKPLQITNVPGTLDLSRLRTTYGDLTGSGHTIPAANINLVHPSSIAVGATGYASVTMLVPAGTYATTYSGIQWVYEDVNGNGTWNTGEASRPFTLTVTVPSYPAIQVQTSLVSFGDLTEGAVATVTFNCRNTGNVDLTALRWQKPNLVSGGNTIGAAQYWFPPTAPTSSFTVPAGTFFSQAVTITVPNPQAYGDYTATPVWLYNDTDGDYPVTVEPGEPQSAFTLHAKIGTVSLDILESQVTTTGVPAAVSDPGAYNVKNTGNLSLIRPMASATTNLVGPWTISATASQFTPNPLGVTIPLQTSAGQWRVTVPAGAPAGDYLGTLTVWNDANADAKIQSTEARDTAPLKLTVTAKKVIQVVENPVNLGLATQGMSVTRGITIVNAGNVDLGRLRGWAGTLEYPGFDTIPAANGTFTSNPICLNLTTGAAPVPATFTVTMKTNQALGPYASDTFFIYEDANNSGDYTSGEVFATFTVSVQVARMAISVTSPPAPFGNQNPGATVSQGFTIRNSGSFPLTANVKWLPRAMEGGGNVIATAATTFPPPSPAVPFTMLVGDTFACSVRLTIASTTPPGTYLGTHTVWADLDGEGDLDDTEASATFQTSVTVNAVASLTLLPDTAHLGSWAPTQTTTPVEVGFQNTGNTTLSGFTWGTYLDLLNGLGDSIPATLFSSAAPVSVAAGAFATTTVWVGPLPDVPVGTYSRTGFTFQAGAAGDSCSFTLHLTHSLHPVPDVGSGSVFQAVATSTFAAVLPPEDNRFIISGWVCPGSGAAALGLFLARSDQSEAGFLGVKIASTGAVTPLGGVVEAGILERIVLPDAAGVMQTWYRVYASFDYTFTETVASSTSLVLSNESPTTASHSVWFDAVQFEQAVFPEQTRPTSFSPGRKVVSPNQGLDLEGRRIYYEW
ncbi:MAG: hypothetical protein GX442_06500 [Candidatus Riflebacteria bacterium]|nr:hypothetical protein [Candidatus Riflebacteria bacterium]